MGQVHIKIMGIKVDWFSGGTPLSTTPYAVDVLYPSYHWQLYAWASEVTCRIIIQVCMDYGVLPSISMLICKARDQQSSWQIRMYQLVCTLYGRRIMMIICTVLVYSVDSHLTVDWNRMLIVKEQWIHGPTELRCWYLDTLVRSTLYC